MNPASAKQLREKGVALLRSKGNAALYRHSTNPETSSERTRPRPIISVDERYIQERTNEFLSRLPGLKSSYSFPEIATALDRSPNWARQRYGKMEGLIDTGNGSKKYLQVPQDLLIADYRLMICRNNRK
jgi:hypothetical protein